MVAEYNWTLNEFGLKSKSSPRNNKIHGFIFMKKGILTKPLKD